MPAAHCRRANAGRVTSDIGSLVSGIVESDANVILMNALRAAGGERDCDERLRRAQEKNTECRQRGGCNVASGIVAPNVCANCGASDDPGPDGVKLRPCSVCKTARYCERGCQVEHWKAHKPDCTAATPAARAEALADLPDLVPLPGRQTSCPAKNHAPRLRRRGGGTPRLGSCRSKCTAPGACTSNETTKP